MNYIKRLEELRGCLVQGDDPKIEDNVDGGSNINVFCCTMVF